VYANLEDTSIRPKLREKLEAGRDSAYLSYDLATIRCEAPIDFEPKDALVIPYNRPELYQLFTRLEFVRLIDKYGLRGAGEALAKAEKKGTSLPRVDTLPDANQTLAVYVAADGSIGIAWEKGVTTVTPLEVFSLGDLLAEAKELILHDSKATMHALDAMGISVSRVGFDTALAAYDLNPSQSDYPISKLATNFLATDVADGDAVACAEAVWNLRPILEEELKKQGMERLYYDIELPLCPVLYRMEIGGASKSCSMKITLGIGGGSGE
jgi:DNA polymerase-1